MIKKFCDQRIAVLVDGQNILISARARHARPDYKKILERINGRQLVRAITYIVETSGGNIEKFKTAIQYMGFEVKAKYPKILPDGSSKADWDMQIAVDAMSIADKVDVITLISGDGDFEALVHALRSRGVKVEVMSFPETTAYELKKAADEWFPITEEMLMRERIVDAAIYEAIKVSQNTLPNG